jgi:2-polyprenyl-6-methoxyphenol hydroxylase-like FAD-dependent oxidoreductase
MRVVIVGGGMAGLLLATALIRRGTTPVVLERMPAGITIPGPIMLPYQAFDPLTDVGVFGEVRAAGRDIAPQRDGTPVAIAVGRQLIIDALSRGVEVHRQHEVIELLREGGRVRGVRVRHPGGERDIEADLVVGADGTFSPVRTMAGIAADLRPAPGAGLSFRSPVLLEIPFAMAYQSDGRQVGVIGWPGGSAGWWHIDRIGEAAAKAPGVEAYRRAFGNLLPEARPALEGVTSPDQLIYREVTEVRCATWWTPGVALIGEAAHATDPESGVGSGLGFGDALALAVAIAGAADADTACRDYEFWRRPAVAPYEAIGGAGARMVPPGGGTGERPEAERWPPVTAA